MHGQLSSQVCKSSEDICICKYDHQTGWKFSWIIVSQLDSSCYVSLGQEDLHHDRFSHTLNVSKHLFLFTKALCFLLALAWYFVPPEVPFHIVSEVKILGVTFSRDCTFTTYINSVTRKANASLQTLPKMRRFGCKAHNSLRTYLCYVRTILEHGCPVWAPSVLRTTYLMQELESVQKRTTRIPYHGALATLELQSLELSLGDLILRFSKMLLSNPTHRDILLPEALKVSRTRQKL